MESSPRKVLLTLSLATLTLLLGVGIGWLAARQPAELTREVIATEDVVEEPGTTASTPVERAADTEPLESPITLADVVAEPAGFERQLAAMQWLAESDVERLGEQILDAKGVVDPAARAQVLEAVFARLAEVSPDTVLRQLDRADLDERTHMITVIFRTWAADDLDDAMAASRRMAVGRDKEASRYGVFAAHLHNRQLAEQLLRMVFGWGGTGTEEQLALVEQARTDPFGALAAAQELTDARKRRAALQGIAGVWAESAPREALENADLVIEPQDRQSFVQGVIVSVARRDPMNALALLDVIDSHGQRRQLVQTVFGTIAQSDPSTALDLARGIEDDVLRRAALGQTFAGWAQTDAEAAAQALLALDDRPLARELAQNLVWSYGASSPREALAWAEAIEGKRGPLWEQMLSQYARSKPLDALEFLEDMPESPRRAQLYARVLGAVARSDPDLALAFTDGLPRGSRWEWAVTQVMWRWLTDDPKAAVNHLVAMVPRDQAAIAGRLASQMLRQHRELAMDVSKRLAPRARETWIDQVVSQAGSIDPEGTADWLLDFTDEPRFGRWIGTVAGHLMLSDPAAALALVDAVPNREQRVDAQSRLVLTWANTDPAAAATWLAELPEEGFEPDLYGGLAGQWQRYDPTAALTWARGLDSPDHRDAALAAVLRSEYVETTQAIDILGEIRSAETRFESLETRVRSLARFDRDAAWELVDAVLLDDEQREELAEIIDPDP
ncbi:MAG: hypothetical protein AAGE01_18910 [Pseudomonadota bacterium]